MFTQAAKYTCKIIIHVHSEHSHKKTPFTFSYHFMYTFIGTSILRYTHTHTHVHTNAYTHCKILWRVYTHKEDGRKFQAKNIKYPNYSKQVWQCIETVLEKSDLDVGKVAQVLVTNWEWNFLTADILMLTFRKTWNVDWLFCLGLKVMS